MDEVTPAGAAAVAKYFIELYPYVVASGDTAMWDSLSHADCLFCADVSQTYQSRPGAESPPVAVLSLRTSEEIDPGVYFSVSFDVRETSSDGAYADSTALVGVIRDGDRWMIRGVQIDPVARAGA